MIYTKEKIESMILQYIEENKDTYIDETNSVEIVLRDVNRFEGFEILNKEIIDFQVEDYEEGYCYYSDEDRWAWYDGEVYITEKCVEQWLATTDRDDCQYITYIIAYQILTDLNSNEETD